MSRYSTSEVARGAVGALLGSGSGELLRENRAPNPGTIRLELTADGSHLVASGSREARVWPLDAPGSRRSFRRLLPFLGRQISAFAGAAEEGPRGTLAVVVPALPVQDRDPPGEPQPQPPDGDRGHQRGPAPEQQGRCQQRDHRAAEDDGLPLAAPGHPAAREVAEEAAAAIGQQHGRDGGHRQPGDVLHQRPDVGEAGEVSGDDEQHREQGHPNRRPRPTGTS